MKELQKFLGFAGYFRCFVKGFSMVVKPMVDLLAGNCTRTIKGNKRRTPSVHWHLGELQQAAFEKIIGLLTNAPVVAFADYNLPFELHTDASTVSLGAVFYQIQEGHLRPIAYESRGLSRHEKNYPAHKLEFLCLKWATTEKFHDYLYGNHCEVKTDNNPLTYILTSAKLDAVGHRWLAAMSLYDLSISYRSGKSNIDADFLSRLPECQSDTVEGNELVAVDSSCVSAVRKSTVVNSGVVESLCMDEDMPRVVDFNITGQNISMVKDVASPQEDDSDIARVIKFLKMGEYHLEDSFRARIGQ